MTDGPEMLPYGPHVQRLLAYLDEVGCGLSELAAGRPGVRDEAETFIASFIRSDKPDEPERFRAVASRVVAFLQRFARDGQGGGAFVEGERYRLLKSSLSGMLAEELGPPDGPCFE